MNFKTEKEMTILFKEFINEKILFSDIDYFEELKGLFGVPDFVLIKKCKNVISNILSIELKLKNWKRALIQAFKYKNFSNQSFILIDEFYIDNVLKNLNLFEKFNIGLASLNNKKIFKIYYHPKFENPYSNQYIKKLEKIISNDNITYIFNNENNYLFNITKKYIVDLNNN